MGKITISILLRAMFRAILYVFFAIGIVLVLFLIYVHGIRDRYSYCDSFTNEEYKQAKVLFEKTLDYGLGSKVNLYEKFCLKDKRAAEKTEYLKKMIIHKAESFKYEILQTIINDPEISKSTLIKSEYISSKYIKDTNESNRHISKSVDILLNSCDDKCIEEIFRVSHNVIFDTKVQPCEIVKEDIKLREENNQESNKHLDFLKRYCNK